MCKTYMLKTTGHWGTILPPGLLALTTMLGDCSVDLRARAPACVVLARTGRGGVGYGWLGRAR